MPGCSQCGFESEGTFTFCPACGAAHAVAPPSREQRKTVTVVFCDLTGSTALGESLDPERLRSLLARYFEGMRAIVERHGGTVEKFIGDAVMAVFGVPLVHEDDALRAVRAAVEMRDALPELGLQGRIGVMTGEVVTGTAERLVTGDAVNVAARLEQAAQPGEVLVGQPTYVLVRDAVDIAAVEPLVLKGKADPVPAYRVVRVLEEPERRHDRRFVGRAREVAIVQEAVQRASLEQGCVLVTIVGDAGVGKSRLVAEALASADATVVRGRCLPYGEGITYWPVVEVLKQLDVLPPDEAAAFAIRSLLGESEAVTSAEDIAWAFRKTLEHAAAQRPLVVVFDDIQWGEETFRDLIEHVALLSTGAPILLLCMARPELGERRPDWPVALRLEPLSDRDVDELIPDQIAGGLRKKITRAAGGNPLFIGEMLEMAHEAGDHAIAVPPTLQALLATRLDQLDATERSALECASIEGEIFHRGAVQALTADEPHVTPRLAALVRKQLIEPTTAMLPGDDGFRFRHLLIRDAAYDALPKAIRADLHERFAGWLAHRGTDLVELDEILGHHLERSCLYRAELGLPIDEQVAVSARRSLAAAGRRARLRGDDDAAVSLLERGVALVPATAIDLDIEAELIDVLYWSGRADEALPRAESTARRASALGDHLGALCARIQIGLIHAYRGSKGGSDGLAALLDEALPVFETAGDDRALYIACEALGQVAHRHGKMDAALEAYERAAEHARRANIGHLELGWRSAFLFYGTTPLSRVLEWLDDNEPRDSLNSWLHMRRANALSMLGRFDEAREILVGCRADLEQRGVTERLAGVIGVSAEVERRAGDAAAAVELAVLAQGLHEQLGVSVVDATAELAMALYALGSYEDADIAARLVAQHCSRDDVFAQAAWRQVQAKVLAHRGEHADAHVLAREAVAACERTDMLDAQGDAYSDLAEVLLLGGKPDEAAEALEHALDRYERKGSLVSAQRTRERLSVLRAASAS